MLRIGKNNYLYGPLYFNGLIDEARVSNAAVYTGNFTPQEHLTASGSTKGLWKFDNQTTTDSSGNGNNGTLQGGATYSSDVPGGGGGGGGGGASSSIQWLVTDHLGTPRMIFDQTGSLANMKRHDYLPFGEELFAPVSGRSAAQGYAGGDGVRQQFTQKERDSETGLDYFGARYYASSLGRFTGADPYDINIERQLTDDRDEGERMLQEYLEQPQHWNRYTYALNNPLKFIDPDGLDPEQFDEYTRTLLGKDITVRISKDLDEKQRIAILNEIDTAINKINDGTVEGLKEAYTLNSKEIEGIKSLNGLTVSNRIAWSHMNVKEGNFMMTSALVLNGENDGLTGGIVHDSFHQAQKNAKKDYTGKKAEMQASSFAVGVAWKLQLSEATIQNLCRDSKFGHRPPSNNPYIKPRKKK